MVLEHAWADLRSALFRRDEIDALPVMDGPLMPNKRLDEAPVLGAPLRGCDDVATGDDGSVFVSAGRQIVQLSGADLDERRVVAAFDHAVTALTCAHGALYAGLAGAGVVKLTHGREVARLGPVDGRPLHCPTAITALPDGRIAIAEGSSLHLPEQWCRDLMERRALGRIVFADAGLGSAISRLDQLAWPYGLAVSADGAELWFSESWRHRVLALSLHEPQARAPRVVLRNLPGYPARLYADDAKGYWLSVPAVRTHLVELVLRETRYREEMLAAVAPEFWIAPALGASGHYLEPLQGGSIKKLGVMKPWAPPRSYGLVLRLSLAGECLESLHSRVGGTHHGITAARRAERDGEGRLLIVSKGSGRVLAIDTERAP